MRIEVLPKQQVRTKEQLKPKQENRSKLAKNGMSIIQSKAKPLESESQKFMKSCAFKAVE